MFSFSYILQQLSMVDWCYFTFNSIVHLYCNSLAVSWYICDLLLLLICIYKRSCWSSHLFYHLLALTVDVTYYHIRCCGVIWSAFTFSEELGFEEGGHGGLLSPCNWNLVTSGRLVHLLPLFMVIWHLGKAIFIIIQMDLGLFLKLCVFL